MTALRCTAKLLKAMKAAPAAQPAPTRNRLGEWTANLIRFSRIQLVVAVNDATRFGVVIDAAPYAQIPLRLTERIFKALLSIGIPADLAAEEAEAMRPLEFAASNSKSVLGTLNQYAVDVDCGLSYGCGHSATELSARLADNIVLKPAHIGFPADRVREAFGLPPLDRRARIIAETGKAKLYHFD